VPGQGVERVNTVPGRRCACRSGHKAAHKAVRAPKACVDQSRCWELAAKRGGRATAGDEARGESVETTEGNDAQKKEAPSTAARARGARIWCGYGPGSRMAALESCRERVGVGRRQSGAQCQQIAGT
jgi:hypothetical protein